MGPDHDADALQAYQLALAIDDANGWWWFQLGLLHKWRGRFREALDANPTLPPPLQPPQGRKIPPHDWSSDDEKEEQELAEGCRRLLKNAIICWNYLYLTQQLNEAPTEARRDDLLESIRQGSVVSWQHLNLHGEYDFSDEKLRDTVGLDLPTMVGELAGPQWEVRNHAQGRE